LASNLAAGRARISADRGTAIVDERTENRPPPQAMQPAAILDPG
jgi:hypothetical protein